MTNTPSSMEDKGSKMTKESNGFSLSSDSLSAASQEFAPSTFSQGEEYDILLEAPSPSSFNHLEDNSSDPSPPSNGSTTSEEQFSSSDDSLDGDKEKDALQRSSPNVGIFAKKALRRRSWTSMCEHFGPVSRWLAKRYFSDIHIPEERLEELKRAKEEGTLVYVLRSQSYLNCLIYNDLFIRNELPLARMCHGLYWLPWQSFLTQVRVLAGWIGRIFGHGKEDVSELFRDLVAYDEATLFFLNHPKTWFSAVRRFFYKGRDGVRRLLGLKPGVGGEEPDLLEELVALQRQQERPIFLAPQIMIWTRTPSRREHSFWDALFGEKEFPGLIREIYLFLKDRRKSWVRGGSPINLKEYIAEFEGENDAQIAQRLRERLNHRLDREYRAVTGPVMKPTEELKQEILQSVTLQLTIKKVAEQEGKSEKEIQKRAKKILDRLAADPYPNVTKWFNFFLDRFWERMYNSVFVDETGIEQVREAAIKSPLLLVPSHKSHIDYLIISQIFYKYDLGLPFIASGDNLILPIIGWIFRHSGAFFIRRSFGDDILYKTIFAEYIHQVITEGYTIEFFIEGGRSRTGKLRGPRMGFLTTATEVVFDGQIEDIHIVPISIDYEKIIEGELYSKELRGADKEKESFQQVLNARKVLSLNFGGITISFATPISVRQYAEEKIRQRRKENPHYDPYKNLEDRQHLIASLAYRILYDINKVSLITSTSLLATVLLTHHRRGISRSDLLTRMDWLAHEVRARGGQLAHFEDIEATLDHSIEALGKLIKQPKGLLEPVYRPRESRWIELGYYRNQIIHLFINDGFIACAMRAFENSYTPFPKIPYDALVEEVRLLSRFMKLEFVFKPPLDLEGNFAQSIAKLTERGIVKYQAGDIQVARSGRVLIQFLRSLFAPFIDAYWIASLSLLELYPDKVQDEKTLLKTMQMMAETLYHQGYLRYSDAVAKETLKNALMLFKDFGLIYRKSSHPKGRKRSIKEISLQEDYRDLEKITQFIQSIGKFASCDKSTAILNRLLERHQEEKRTTASHPKS